MRKVSLWKYSMRILLVLSLGCAVPETGNDLLYNLVTSNSKRDFEQLLENANFVTSKGNSTDEYSGLLNNKTIHIALTTLDENYVATMRVENISDIEMEELTKNLVSEMRIDRNEQRYKSGLIGRNMISIIREEGALVILSDYRTR